MFDGSVGNVLADGNRVACWLSGNNNLGSVMNMFLSVGSTPMSVFCCCPQWISCLK
jgi:hypothetical protein